MLFYFKALPKEATPGEVTPTGNQSGATEDQDTKPAEDQTGESQSAENQTTEVQQEASKEEQQMARKTPSKPKQPKQQVNDQICYTSAYSYFLIKLFVESYINVN